MERLRIRWPNTPPRPEENAVEIRLKHETAPIEVYFTSATAKTAPAIISFVQNNGILVDGNATPLEYKSHGIVANSEASWLRITVGPI
jgi:hypothetical protein